jgi:hypothetical protein
MPKHSCFLAVALSVAGCSGLGSSATTSGSGTGGQTNGGGTAGSGSGGGTVSGSGSGGTTTCSSCANPSCGNGIAIAAPSTICGLTNTCVAEFCQGGCSPGGTTCLSPTLPDGGIGSCEASSLTRTNGAFMVSSDDAGLPGGVAVEQGSLILLATSAEVACEATLDAGNLQPPDRAAVITIDTAAFGSGTFGEIILDGGVTLTRWIDGGAIRVRPDGGPSTLTVSLDQAGGGVMVETYSFAFGSDLEQGSFIAPECDVCLTPPQ